MKRFIVTGGSGGLGREICQQLSAAGKRVVNLDILPPTADAGARHFHCNLADPKDLGAKAQKAVWWLDGLDCLVNNAGLNFNAWLEDTPLREWQKVLDVNVTAPFLLTQEVLPYLSKAEGTVCNIVSNAAWVPMRSSVAYNSSKAAEHMLTQQLARELTRRHNITVFGIYPGKLKGTGMSRYIEQRVQEVRGWTPEQAAEYQSNGLVTGEEIEPAVLAEFIVWLLLEKKRHFYLSGCRLDYGG